MAASTIEEAATQDMVGLSEMVAMLFGAKSGLEWGWRQDVHDMALQVCGRDVARITFEDPGPHLAIAVDLAWLGFIGQRVMGLGELASSAQLVEDD